MRRNPFRSSSRWVHGTYQSGLEVSAFLPDGTSERWWVSRGKLDQQSMADLNARAQGIRVDVELKGVASDRGEYGHMGLYQREFTVDAVREFPAGTKAEATE